VRRGLAAELGGRVTLEFAQAGVVCRIEAPRANVVASADAEGLFPLPV
jgi:hypothetical protein